MRSGRLDREIIIESLTTTANEFGTPHEVWTAVACARAELLQSTAAEFLRGYGEAQTIVAVFRTRWIDGISTEHRVRYDGKHLHIREIKEIGRRRGLELRCEQVR